MASRRNTEGEEQQDINSSSTKRQKTALDPDAIEQRMLITNEESSIVIGRKGSNVERVRNESDALVTILKSSLSPTTVNERVMIIKGNPSQIATAINVIARILVENNRGTANPTTGATDVIVVKFLFHKFLAGCVIGQGGSIMKEIQTSTNVRLSISTGALGGSTEKACSVTGTPDAIYAASMRIIDQLVTNPLRPGCSTVLYVPGQLGGPGEPYPLSGPDSGYFGASAPYGGDQFGQYGGAPFQDFAPPAPQGDGMPLRITPLYQAGGAPSYPQDAGYYPPPGNFGRNEPYRIEQKGPPMRGPGGMQRIVPLVSLPANPSVTGNTQKIVIPKVASGAVIGRGGTIIASIKSQSGTQISIADAAANSEDRVVSITGTPQAIQNAIFLIRQRVDAQANALTGQFV